jgi:hypothetical protein
MAQKNSAFASISANTKVREIALEFKNQGNPNLRGVSKSANKKPGLNLFSQARA